MILMLIVPRCGGYAYISNYGNLVVVSVINTTTNTATATVNIENLLMYIQSSLRIEGICDKIKLY
jgi:YVTN family beta-propeller protein